MGRTDTSGGEEEETSVRALLSDLMAMMVSLNTRMDYTVGGIKKRKAVCQVTLLPVGCLPQCLRGQPTWSPSPHDEPAAIPGPLPHQSGETGISRLRKPAAPPPSLLTARRDPK